MLIKRVKACRLGYTKSIRLYTKVGMFSAVATLGGKSELAKRLANSNSGASLYRVVHNNG